MKAKIEVEVNGRKVAEEAAGLVVAPFVGGGIMTLLMAAGFAVALVVSMAGSVPNAVMGMMECGPRGYAASQEAWFKCMEPYPIEGFFADVMSGLAGG